MHTLKFNGWIKNMLVSPLQLILFSGVLFMISLLGLVINRKNLLILLLCLELLLVSVNTNFVAFSAFLNHPPGQIMVLFVLSVAAAEVAIGLSILMIIFRQRRTIELEGLDQLKG
jgi:NADH-quinone oxidoreductase subunit K